jgi:hypothetical protein
MFICLMGETAIGLVAHHTTRTLLRSPAATTLHRTPGQEPFEPNGFVTLTRCQPKRHQLCLTCRAQMDFGAQAALASTQGFRFGTFGRTCRVLMRSNAAAIDIMNRPVQLTRGIGLLLNGLEEALPDAGSSPAIEAAGHGAPGAIGFGQITPGRTRAQQPQDAGEDASMARSGSAGLRLLRGKQRWEPLPLRVGEVSSFHHGEWTQPSRVCKHALESVWPDGQSRVHVGRWDREEVSQGE